MGAMKSLATEADYASVLKTANRFKDEANQLRDDRAELVKALKRIIARSTHCAADTNEDRIRDLRHIEAIAKEAAELAERSR